MQLEGLLTVQQVAELAKIEVQSVYQYRLRGTIPEPDFHLGPMLLWERATIENWLATRPKKGRPKLAGGGRPACKEDHEHDAICGWFGEAPVHTPLRTKLPRSGQKECFKSPE